MGDELTAQEKLHLITRNLQVLGWGWGEGAEELRGQEEIGPSTARLPGLSKDGPQRCPAT